MLSLTCRIYQLIICYVIPGVVLNVNCEAESVIVSLMDHAVLEQGATSSSLVRHILTFYIIIEKVELL